MLAQALKNHLTQKILPFWQKLTDETYGGWYGYVRRFFSAFLIYMDYLMIIINRAWQIITLMEKLLCVKRTEYWKRGM